MKTGVIRALGAIFVLFVLSSCATTSSIDQIWEKLTANDRINNDQDIKLSRLERNVIELSFPEELLFGFDANNLQPRAVRELEKLAKILNDYPNIKIYISGHTDNTGPKDYNLKLSEKRAQSVASLLFESGLGKEQLHTKGHGESHPITSNLTKEGRKQNRRVDISLSSDESPDTRAQLNTKENL